MLDVCLGLLLLGIGFWAGRKSVRTRPQPEQKSEQELQKLREDRTAFAQLMGYNVEKAYGREE